MDFAITRAPLPETKCVQARFLPQETAWQPGCSEVHLRSRGCWRRNREASSWFVQEGAIMRHGSSLERAEETLECFRVVFQDPSNWESAVAASLKCVLTVRERLALPSRSNHVRWTGDCGKENASGSVVLVCEFWGVHGSTLVYRTLVFASADWSRSWFKSALRRFTTNLGSSSCSLVFSGSVALPHALAQDFPDRCRVHTRRYHIFHLPQRWKVLRAQHDTEKDSDIVLATPGWTRERCWY